MSYEIENNLLADFSLADRPAALEAFATILPSHTMGGGQNRINTLHAIAHLANGNLQELLKLVEHAKIDFRDLILWHQMSGDDSKRS